jgi:hypothetical protein
MSRRPGVDDISVVDEIREHRTLPVISGVPNKVAVA